ncbi:metalloregulator ArsR/SmtB family transcription factor [Ectothiorhodospiraceae bacterium 2226]|nr:metalloregulator ArsR/SmtB family transcription factor [Ectothiorhodospiraceae bacterium 2226]
MPAAEALTTPAPLDAELLLRTLADGTRLRTLALLLTEGELCVCELTHALEVSQPKMSRHLAVLREAALVQDRRAGRWMYYRLPEGLPAWARQVLEGARGGLAAQHAADRARLVRMSGQPSAACCG